MTTFFCHFFYLLFNIVKQNILLNFAEKALKIPLPPAPAIRPADFKLAVAAPNFVQHCVKFGHSLPAGAAVQTAILFGVWSVPLGTNCALLEPVRVPIAGFAVWVRKFLIHNQKYAIICLHSS